MNNLTIGGIDDRRGTATPFAYYETIAAAPEQPPMPGVQACTPT